MRRERGAQGLREQGVGGLGGRAGRKGEEKGQGCLRTGAGGISDPEEELTPVLK